MAASLKQNRTNPAVPECSPVLPLGCRWRGGIWFNQGTSKVEILDYHKPEVFTKCPLVNGNIIICMAVHIDKQPKGYIMCYPEKKKRREPLIKRLGSVYPLLPLS